MTRWNRLGLHWRQMSTPEILWLVHEETVSHLKEHEPKKVRRYLMDMGDDEALIAWDRENMKSRTSS